MGAFRRARGRAKNSARQRPGQLFKWLRAGFEPFRACSMLETIERPSDHHRSREKRWNRTKPLLLTQFRGPGMISGDGNLTERLKTGAEQRREQQSPRRAEFSALPSAFSPLLIPCLRFFRGLMLLELFHLGSNHQLTVSLGRILGEIVLVIVFSSIEMF